MDSLVQDVLKSSAEKDAKYKTTEVKKDIDVDIDEGHLLTIDQNPLDLLNLRSKRDVYLKALARDNVQLLINRIWELPVERVEEVIVAKLPDPKTILPREKPVPKAKPPTKWEQYMQDKGIRKKKKDNLVFDERSKEWKPRYGYKRADDETKDWVIEVPANADPNEDQFAKRMNAKKERIAKNELQRLRNMARNTKKKVPGVGLTPTEAPDKDQVTRALHLAKSSTASLGKFTKDLSKEKPAKNMGKKRKFEPTFGDMDREKKRSLNILDKLHSPSAILNKDQAANQEIHSEERNRSQMRERKGKKGKGAPGKGPGGKGGGKGGGKAPRKGFTKGKGKGSGKGRGAGKGSKGKGKKG